MTLRFDSSIGDWVDDSMVWDPVALRMIPKEQADAIAALPPNLRAALSNRESGNMDAVSQAKFKQAGINPNLKIYGGNGQVAAPGTTPDGVTADVPFGGYDSGFWGEISNLGQLASYAALAYGGAGAVGSMLGAAGVGAGAGAAGAGGTAAGTGAGAAAAGGGAATGGGMLAGPGGAIFGTSAGGTAAAALPGIGGTSMGSLAGMAGGAAAGGTALANGLTSGAGGNTLNTPDWVNTLLQQTGEAGQSAGALEAGLNPAMQGTGLPWLDELVVNNRLDSPNGILSQLTNGEVGGTPTGQTGGTGGGNTTANGNGQYQLPWQFLLGAVLPRLIGAQGNKQSWQQAYNDVLTSDPWRAEQGKYMPLLLDTAQHGIGGTAYGDAIADSTARKMASMGYNMSGNQMHEIANGLDAGTNQRIQALSPLAMGRAPDTRGLAPIAAGMAQANDQQTGAIQSGLGSIFSGTPNNNQQFSLSNLFNGLKSIFS